MEPLGNLDHGTVSCQKPDSCPCYEPKLLQAEYQDKPRRTKSAGPDLAWQGPDICRGTIGELERSVLRALYTYVYIYGI